MYLFFKSLHIISFVAWMAGLLYLPRLFVYHSEETENKKIYKKFLIMEYRLLKFIMNPAMISTWIFGLLMTVYNADIFLQSFWFALKLLLTLILSAFHAYLAICRKNFVNNINNKSPKFFRLINEVPTVILILVVFLVVFKPSI